MFVIQQTYVAYIMRNRTQYLTVLQFDLCGVQGDKLDHYRKGAVPEQQMFPISYVKGCKNIHQYTPGTGELVLVLLMYSNPNVQLTEDYFDFSIYHSYLCNNVSECIYLVIYIYRSDTINSNLIQNCDFGAKFSPLTQF